jgi:EmrB/QacA subfamily drug resistance transporter
MSSVNQLPVAGWLGRLAGPTRAGSAARRRWLVLVVAVAAQFMVVLDVAVVNVALPAIKSDLGFSQESLQWVITAYAILFGGVLLLGGRLADLLGRRRLFAAGVALFTVGSLLSGLAWSESTLIVFRALQGLGGALLSPAALSIVVTTFAEGRERNTALGIWGAVSGSGVAAGVLLGGVLTSYLGWPWIFFVNIPVGAAVLAVTPLLLSESRSAAERRHFDVAGAASITGGLMLAVYAMTRAAGHGWGDPFTLAPLAAAAALVAAFVVIERRSAAPLLPLRIFRARTVSAANVVMLAIGSATLGEFFLLTLYLQQVLGYSAIETGLAFIALAGTVAVTSNAAQRLTSRLGARPVLTVGMLLSAASTLLYAQLPADAPYFAEILPAFLLGGVGLALSAVPVTIAGLTGAAPADAGVASGLINTTRQVGGAIGLGLVTTIAATTTGHYLHGHPAASQATALTHGFDVAFYLLAGLSLLGAEVAAGLLRTARPRPAPTTPAARLAGQATARAPAHVPAPRLRATFRHHGRPASRPAHGPRRSRPALRRALHPRLQTTAVSLRTPRTNVPANPAVPDPAASPDGGTTTPRSMASQTSPTN